MANRIVSIPILCAFQQTQTIAAGSTQIDVSIVRAFSKLSSVWVTFSGNTARNTNFRCPATSSSTLGAIPNLDDGTWCPTARLAIGGKNYPDPQPVTNIAEHYLSLIEALGYSPNISRDSFSKGNSFCLAFDLRKVPGDHGTAIGTRSGDLVRLSVQNMTADAATQVHVTLWAYSVAAIRESGVSLLN